MLKYLFLVVFITFITCTGPMACADSTQEAYSTVLDVSETEEFEDVPVLVQQQVKDIGCSDLTVCGIQNKLCPGHYPNCPGTSVFNMTLQQNFMDVFAFTRVCYRRDFSRDYLTKFMKVFIQTLQSFVKTNTQFNSFNDVKDFVKNGIKDQQQQRIAESLLYYFYLLQGFEHICSRQPHLKSNLKDQFQSYITGQQTVSQKTDPTYDKVSGVMRRCFEKRFQELKGDALKLFTKYENELRDNFFKEILTSRKVSYCSCLENNYFYNEISTQVKQYTALQAKMKSLSKADLLNELLKIDKFTVEFYTHYKNVQNLEEDVQNMLGLFLSGFKNYVPIYSQRLSYITNACKKICGSTH